MRTRRRSRIQFQPPFLVGALGALTLSAAGCRGLTVDGAGSGGTGGGALDGEVTVDGCPTVLPEDGTACPSAQLNLTCGTLISCDPGRSITCGEDGVWHENYISCNPPPVSSTCPDVQPVEGEVCSYYEAGLVCGVASCDGDPGIVCGDDGLWHLDYLFCNPPGLGGMGGVGELGGSGSGP